jgi:hypothetical protein
MSESLVIVAHTDNDDCCQLCGRVASTAISDADGWFRCSDCESEREAWQRCEGCAVLVPITAMRRVDGDIGADELCTACVDKEHEARERDENDGRYVNGTDWER